MNPRTVREEIAGPAGRIECAIDRPEGTPRGVAIVCHPHPQFGGTLDNKVVQMVARTFLQLGWTSVRFNFRGIGRSEGAWDEGRGEVEDAAAVVAAVKKRSEFAGLPWALAGFSFGGYVAATVADRLPEGEKPRRLVLVGPSTEKQAVPNVPADTVVLHGEVDDVVPLSATLAWARPQSLPVIVFPGVGHFFHGQLTSLKNVLLRELHELAAV
ncbi:MAG: alpha/beta fold hydrolase [Burkholderiales bacterium]|nr:alpha/beta fold hydrolase [Burkholderiales bacterium]